MCKVERDIKTYLFFYRKIPKNHDFPSARHFTEVWLAKGTGMNVNFFQSVGAPRPSAQKSSEGDLIEETQSYLVSNFGVLTEWLHIRQ